MITGTSTLVEHLVETEQERAFWEVVRHHERPPFYDAKEGVGNRLNRAARIVYEERLTPNSDGSYTVEGSEGHTYRVREHCSCPDSTYRKERGPCYHEIAVVLYVEWQRRLGPRPTVELGTLRAGTLPLPTTTLDAQEDLMADDQYIPEPEMDDTPVAILEPPAAPPVTRQLPGPVLLPSLDARTLEQSMQAYAAQRAVVTRYIKEQMTEGVDYYTLTIKGRVSKATLSKAGSEKFLSLFQLHAAFQQDEATWRMLGSKDGLLCYTCMLMTRQGEVIGEGRGARSVTQDGGDINKAIKMACKSAQVDAVLRTGALSDVFTQDLEQEADAPAPVKPNPLHPSAELRQKIWAKVQEMAPQAKTREAVEAFIKERTGMDLHPDFYEAVLARLEGRASTTAP